MSIWLSVEETANKVRSGELKAIDLVEKSLKEIESKKEFNAVIAVISERSKQRAAQIDKDIAEGKTGY